MGWSTKEQGGYTLGKWKAGRGLGELGKCRGWSRCQVQMAVKVVEDWQTTGWRVWRRPWGGWVSGMSCNASAKGRYKKAAE